MRRYILTPAAQADLDGIWRYTDDMWTEAQAERYIRSIKDACDALAEGRRKGQNADMFRAGYFRYAVGSHFVFYKVTAEGTVQIMRVLHKQMDLKSRLEG